MHAREWRMSPGRDASSRGVLSAALGRYAETCRRIDAKSSSRLVFSPQATLKTRGVTWVSRCARGEQICLNDVFDEAKVAARAPVAEHHARLAREKLSDPARNHRGIRPVGILPRPENVEVAKPDAVDAVTAREGCRVDLVDALARRVRRKRLARASLRPSGRTRRRRTRSSMTRTRHGGPPPRAPRARRGRSRQRWRCAWRAGPASSGERSRAPPRAGRRSRPPSPSDRRADRARRPRETESARPS